VAEEGIFVAILGPLGRAVFLNLSQNFRQEILLERFNPP